MVCVFDDKIVEAGTSVLVALARVVVPASSSAAPHAGCNNFYAPLAVREKTPNTSWLTQYVAAAFSLAGSAGFTASPNSPLAMPRLVETSVPALLTPAPSPVPAVASQPAANETRQMSFQQSKRPDTFGEA